MRYTDRLGIPYPERPDTADVPRDTEAIAVAADVFVPYLTGPMGSRPAAGVAGRIYAATDKSPGVDPDYLTMDVGTTWISVSFNMGIPDRSINHVKLMLATITIAEMGSGSVGNAQLVDNSISTTKIAPAQIGFYHIGPGLRPSQGVVNTQEALRALMNPVTGTPSNGLAAQGKHAIQHKPGGPDPLDAYYMIKNSYVTNLPATANDGDEIYLAVDAANGIIWHMRYDNSTGRWRYLGGHPVTIMDSSENETSDNAWRNSGGTWQAPWAGAYLYDYRMEIWNNASDSGSDYALGGVAVTSGGGGSLADNDRVITYHAIANGNEGHGYELGRLGRSHTVAKNENFFFVQYHGGGHAATTITANRIMQIWPQGLYYS